MTPDPKGMTALADDCELYAKVIEGINVAKDDWQLGDAVRKEPRETLLKAASVLRNIANAPASGAEQMREACAAIADKHASATCEGIGSETKAMRLGAQSIANEIRALPAPPAAGLDREAVADTETVARFKLLCETLRFASDKDVLMVVKKDDVEIAFRILALQAAPSTKIMKKPQCDGLLTCLAAKYDGVVCPEDTCDWDTGVRKPPSTKTDGER